MISFLPVLAMALASMLGGDGVLSPGHLPMPDMTDAEFDLIASGQSLAAAMVLVVGLRLSRGRRRG